VAEGPKQGQHKAEVLDHHRRLLLMEAVVSLRPVLVVLVSVRHNLRNSLVFLAELLDDMTAQQIQVYWVEWHMAIIENHKARLVHKATQASTSWGHRYSGCKEPPWEKHMMQVFVDLKIQVVIVELHNCVDPAVQRTLV
jgi:hypothetical protein